MIGGGGVALHKLLAISQFTDNITLIAQEFKPEINESNYKCIQKPYEAKDLQGFQVIYACTNNKQTNQQIHQDAKAQNSLINVADNPELCDFISPAIFKKDEMSVAISSGGKNVKKAVAWRNKIKEIIMKDAIFQPDE